MTWVSGRCRGSFRRAATLASGSGGARWCMSCCSIYRRWPRSAGWGGAGVSWRASAEEAEVLTEQTLAVLRHPELAALFGPGSRAEQPITGVVGATVITGKVDRLACCRMRC